MVFIVVTGGFGEEKTSDMGQINRDMKTKRLKF